MMTNFLKRLFLVFSLFATLSVGVLFACAYWDWGWFGNSNFAPETFVDKSYHPLFYDQDLMFYCIGYDDQYISRFNDEIARDWMSYLNGKLDSTYVDYFLLNDSSAVAVTDIYNSYKDNQPNDWSDHIDLKNEKVRNFIEFLYFAKDIEYASTTHYDPWDYEEGVEKPTVSPEIIAEVENRYNKANDPFLKSRYWFQTVKGLFYSADRNSVIAFMDKSEANVVKNTLYYRALAYKAGAYYLNQEYAQSNYLYSIVFDKSPALRTVTAYNFHPQSDEDWGAALDLAKTNDEKAALWALLGYYADPVRAIEEIYNLNPKNPHISYLLTRVINIQEMQLQEVYSSWPANLKDQLSSKIDDKMVKLVTDLALNEKCDQPQLWFMAAGYLQTLKQDFAQAKSLFDRAEKRGLSTPLAKDQLRVLRYINSVSSMDVMSTTNEQALLSELEWLKSDEPKAENLRLAAINWSRRYISNLYENANNLVFAELFWHSNEFYKEQSRLLAMKAFLASESKTPYERLAQSIYEVKLEEINNYQAILFTYQNEIDQALVAMKESGAIGEAEFYGNPFNGKIQDCHDCDHQAEQKTKFSQVKFLETVKNMQLAIQKGEDLYNNNLLLGNAFYNITHFGNGRSFYQSNLINVEDAFYKPFIYGTEMARGYYQKAFEAATNDEQRAKCSYLLAKCERNDYYNSGYQYSYWGENTQPDFLAWDGFAKLKTNYSHTKYYQDVIEECGYFKTYVEKR